MPDSSSAAWRHPALLLVLPPLFWAGNVVLARGVIDLIPPVTMSFWRWFAALLLILPFTWKQCLHDWPVARKSWRLLGLVSFFGVACFNTLLYTAVHTTTALNCALIQAVMPAAIVVISFLLDRERISVLQGFGIILSILGATVIVLRGESGRIAELSFVRGDLIMAAAVILYALYTVLVRRRPPLHPLSFLTYTMLIGVAMLLPLYAWESLRTPALRVSTDVVLSIGYIAVFPSILAYLCWNRGIGMIGANRAGLYINLIPVFASLLAVALLGETVHLYHLAGVLLVFSGMFLFNFRLLQSLRSGPA